MALRIRRGTDAERQTIIFAEGELVYTTDTKDLYVGDGTTFGGIPAGGGISAVVDDLTPQLGGNLDLNENEINGTGDIDIIGTISANVITGDIFIGDGSGLTNIPGSNVLSIFDLNDVFAFTPPDLGDVLIFDGINFVSQKIRQIEGVDSTIMLDALTNTFTGNFVGDGSGLTNLPVGDGIIEGSNYRINILGDDSSIIINSSDSSITANSINSTVLTVRKDDNGNTSADLILETEDRFSRILLARTSLSDLTNFSGQLGELQFRTEGSNGVVAKGLIQGYTNSIIIAQANQLNQFTVDTLNTFTPTGVKLGGIGPAARLDVNGDAIIDGNLTTDSVILNSVDLLETDVALGKIILSDLDNELYVFNGFDWRTIVTGDEPGIIGPAIFVFSGVTEQERDQAGEDSTEVNGAAIYNSDVDRFQFFQAGSWVSLINNGGSIGQLLAWNGSEWSAVDPVVGEGTIENANFLNGFNGAFYLNYNNFTNTPSIPNDLTDLGISDGTVGQVLTTDGDGNFSFAAVSGLKSRASLTGSTGSISDGASANVNITGYKGYMLYKIQTSAAAWVRLYVSDAARTADASRTQGQDPLPGSGVIAEVITTGAETIIIAPGVIGFNNESPVTNVVPTAVTNLSGGSADITVTLTAVEMEI